MKRRKAVDPFESTRTSQAFYCILGGFGSPKEIAKIMGVKPPAAMQHIRRLIDLGVAERGEKEGKTQYYDANWNNFDREFLNRAVVVKAFYQDEKTGEWRPDPKEDKTVEKIKRLLEGNKYFSRLTTYYWASVAGACLDREGISINEGIRRFEEWLIWIYPEIKRKKSKNKEMREFLQALKLWHERGPWIHLTSLDAVRFAFKELGFL